MKKSFYLLIAGLLFALAASSQTDDKMKQAIKDKIDKAIKDPAREKNSAKADLRIFEKKVIAKR